MLFFGLFAGVAILATHLLFLNLGASSLRGDEAEHAQIAVEMVLHNHWFPPTYSGHPYLHKPTLKMMAVAGIFACRGIDEYGARCLDALSGVILVVLVFVFGAHIWNLRVGAISSLLLLSSEQLVFRHGLRAGVQDASLALLIATSLLLYSSYVNSARSHSALLIGATVALAGATLVKGPMALVVVVPTVVLFKVFVLRPERSAADSSRSLRDVLVLGGTGLGVYAAWFLALWRVVGDPMRRSTYVNLILRNTSGLSPDHVHGLGFYPESLTKDFGPWLLFLLPALFAWIGPEGSRDRRAMGLFGLWVLVAVGLPILSVSKLPWYIYPAYPALALLIGRGIEEVFRQSRRRIVIAAILIVIVGIGLAVRIDRIERRATQNKQVSPVERFARYVKEHPEIRLALRKRVRLNPAEVFYLGSREERTRGTSFLGAPPGCRVLLQNGTEVPPGYKGTVKLVSLRPGTTSERLYALDLDWCLPSWL